MKPEEALTTDGISTLLYAIQIVRWTLHENRHTEPVLCYFSLALKHTHTHSEEAWSPSSDLDVLGHAALWVPTGHTVSKCHTLDGGLKTGWRSRRPDENRRRRQSAWGTLKSKGGLFCLPQERKSERQRPSHYFRICGSRQQTLRATNPAFTATYWGMRREANMGENIVHYWETSGNGVLSVFFCFSSSKKDYGKYLGILTQH